MAPKIDPLGPPFSTIFSKKKNDFSFYCLRLEDVLEPSLARPTTQIVKVLTESRIVVRFCTKLDGHFMILDDLASILQLLLRFSIRFLFVSFKFSFCVRFVPFLSFHLFSFSFHVVFVSLCSIAHKPTSHFPQPWPGGMRVSDWVKRRTPASRGRRLRPWTMTEMGEPVGQGQRRSTKMGEPMGQGRRRSTKVGEPMGQGQRRSTQNGRTTEPEPAQEH
jgi:hypothetical protein